MRHQGGVYIGSAYENTVMFAPFRAVVHPCQYTRRGDHVEFNIPANYVPPKVDTVSGYTLHSSVKVWAVKVACQSISRVRLQYAPPMI